MNPDTAVLTEPKVEFARDASLRGYEFSILIPKQQPLLLWVSDSGVVTLSRLKEDKLELERLL